MNKKNDLKEIIEALKSSPLAQLSLSSRELFHSNFLAWLSETCPSLGSSLFRRFIREQSDNNLIDSVQRESKNIDLWLTFTNREQLIIENKVKSIPTISQLGEYSARVGTEHTSYLLLSLNRPQFRTDPNGVFIDNNGKKWHYLSYGDLSKCLNDALNSQSDFQMGSYHDQIVRDYIGYIGALDALHNHFSVNFQSTDSFFAPDGLELIQQNRFSSGIHKMRYSQLADLLKNQFEELNFRTLMDFTKFWEQSSEAVVIYSGMTRATGVLGFSYLLSSNDRSRYPVGLGVQLQDNQFRLVVQRPPNRSASKAADLLFSATSNNCRWFDFSYLRLPVIASEEYPKRGGFNKFGEDFYYRSIRLERNISANSLVEAILSYAMFIRNNSEAFREILAQVLREY